MTENNSQKQEKLKVTITINDRVFTVIDADPYWFVVEKNGVKYLIPEDSLSCFDISEHLWSIGIAEVVFDITLMREYDEANKQYREKTNAK